MKTHSITVIMLTSILSIAGCGGGEEETTVEEVVTTPPPVDTSPQETISTEDLITTPDFNLSSYRELQVNLPVSPSTTVSHFINICTDFSTLNSNNINASNNIKINYASCKLRTELALTTQQFTLVLSAAEEALIAQVWPIENGANPVNIYWNIAESGTKWHITF